VKLTISLSSAKRERERERERERAREKGRREFDPGLGGNLGAMKVDAAGGRERSAGCRAQSRERHRR